MNSKPFDRNENGRADPSPSEREQALARILSSAEFASSPKLGEFLSYVITEQIEGRTDQIKGKTIAVDVFGRGVDEGSAGHNVVRVEARRLRRLLDEYYGGSGSEDSLRIVIDAGGYVPRFERRGRQFAGSLADEDLEAEPEVSSTQTSAESVQTWRRPVFVAVGVVLLIVLGGLIGAPQSFQSGQLSDGATRSALRDYSVTTLQAKDTAAEARALYFPVFDVRRQKIALDLYDYAIELSPDLSDGHAGAAQVLATLLMLTRDETEAERLMSRASFHAGEAMRLAPSDPWAIASQGWVYAQAGDLDAARQKAKIALELAPLDSHILDLVGVMSIFVNDPVFAADVASRDRDAAPSPGTRNIWGLANLMLGNNAETIEAFQNAPKDGSVVSAPSLVFLAIAHDRLGEKKRAKQLVQELYRSWPEFPVVFVAEQVFQNAPEFSEEIIQRVQNLAAPV